MKYAPLFIFLFFYSGCVSSQQVTSGVIKNYKYTLTANSLNSNDTFNLREFKIWFLDSAVIFETRVVISKSMNDIELPQTFETFKFVYFDLKTMRCQDYYSFSDTAALQCNYKIRTEEGYIWRFYKKGDEAPSPKYKYIGDTVFNAKKLKVVEDTDSVNAHFNIRVLYYLECGLPNYIFHEKSKVDVNYPGCKTLRTDIIDLKQKTTSVFGMELERQGLNEFELNVFKQWGINAQQTTLPLMTTDDANVKCGPYNSPLVDLE